MKQELLKIWRSTYFGYAIDLAMIAVLLIGGLKVSDARNTLNQDGCSAYWTQYKDLDTSDPEFFNKTEFRNLRERSTGLSEPKFQKQELRKNVYE